MIINGVPKMYKEQGVIQTTREKRSYLQNQYLYGGLIPDASQFLSGYPWYDPMSDPNPDLDGTRLVTFGNLNAHTSTQCINELTNKLQLSISKDSKLFTRQKDLHFNDSKKFVTYGTFINQNVYYDYAIGFVSHPFNFKKGKFSVTCKLPQGQWLWPAIWLSRSGHGPYFEIDIMEAWSKRLPFSVNNQCSDESAYCHVGYHNIHMSEYCDDVPRLVEHDPDNDRRQTYVPSNMVWDQVTYECLWTDEGILFWYDNRLVYVAVFNKSLPRYDELRDLNSTVNLNIGCNIFSNNEDFWKSKYYYLNWKNKGNFLGKTDNASGENELMEISNFTYAEWGVDIDTYPDGSNNMTDFIAYLKENANENSPYVIPFD